MVLTDFIVAQAEVDQRLANASWPNAFYAVGGQMELLQVRWQVLDGFQFVETQV